MARLESISEHFLSIVRHLFASRQIAEMLGKEWIYNVTPGWLQSFTDGSRFHEMLQDPALASFFEEPCNLLFAICIDGMNPYNSGTFSLTPMLLQHLGLPAHANEALQQGYQHDHPNHPSKQSGLLCVTELSKAPGFVYSMGQKDSMHLMGNQGGHFQGLLLGLRSGASVVADIRAEGRWPDCGPGQPNPFPWIIPANKLPLIMQWCASVRVPSSFGVRLEAILRTEADAKKGRRVAVKAKVAHALKGSVSGVMTVIVRISLPKQQSKVLGLLFWCWRKLLMPQMEKEELRALQIWVVEAICYFERDFPRSEMLLSLHSMCHLVQQIREYGPLRDLWMFPFESYNRLVKRYAKNRNCPEQSIMERARLSSALLSLSSAIQQDTRPEHSVVMHNHQSEFSLPASQRPPEAQGRKPTLCLLSDTDRADIRRAMLDALPADTVTALQRLLEDAQQGLQLHDWTPSDHEYAAMTKDPESKGIELIRCTGRDDDFDLDTNSYVLAEKVDEQVFYAQLPKHEAPGQGSQPWLWVMRDIASSHLIPEHLFDDDGQLVDVVFNDA
ncbi:hypothetical protein WJX79_005341 [Trebouxia sp. C0005]